jgi:hypothetical protein
MLLTFLKNVKKKLRILYCNLKICNLYNEDIL